VDNVLALFQKLAEIVHVLGDVYLRGAGIGTFCNAIVKDVKGHTLAQIVNVFLAVNGVVEADVGNLACFELLLCKIGCGAAAKYVIGHGGLLSRGVLQGKFTAAK
jgi:hypothetical protein